MQQIYSSPQTGERSLASMASPVVHTHILGRTPVHAKPWKLPLPSGTNNFEVFTGKKPRSIYSFLENMEKLFANYGVNDNAQRLNRVPWE